MKDVDSWFDECIKGIAHLKIKFGKPVKAIKCKNDNHQEVSKQIATLYRNKIKDGTFTDFEMNMIIDAAEDLVNFHYNMKNKIHWSSCTHEKDSVKSIVHHLIDALSEMSPDKAKIQVSWLRGKMFSERLPLWLKKIGMLDAEQTINDNNLLSEDKYKQMMVEIKETTVRLKEKVANLAKLDLPEEEQAIHRKRFSKEITEERDAIAIKYGWVTSKPVEEKKSNDSWMYDSE
jgi:hypothetical protein